MRVMGAVVRSHDVEGAKAFSGSARDGPLLFEYLVFVIIHLNGVRTWPLIDPRKF